MDTRRDLVDPVVCRLAHAGGRPCNGLWDEDSLHLCGVDVWLDLSGSDLSKFSFGGTGGNRQWGTGSTFFYAGFSSEIVVVIIVLTTFIAYANKVGLDNYIAQKFIRIRFLQGHPWLFVTVFMLLIYVLGLMVSIYPTIFLLWPVTYKICDEAGFERGGKFSSYMCFAITFICGLGMLSKPFSPWSLVGLNALNTFMGEGFTINYSLYTAYMFIVSMATIAGFLIVGMLMRMDLTPLKNYKVSDEKVTLTHDQKIGAVFFIAYFAMLYAPSLLPEDWAVTKLLDQMGLLGVGAILLIFLGVARKKGEKLCQVDKLAQNAVPWQIVFLMVSNAVIGAEISNADTGLIKWSLRRWRGSLQSCSTLC